MVGQRRWMAVRMAAKAIREGFTWCKLYHVKLYAVAARTRKVEASCWRMERTSGPW